MSTFFNDQEESQETFNESEGHDTQDLTKNEQATDRIAAEWAQKYSYLSADFENFKRRTLKEYEAMRIGVYVRICTPLLVLMDDFERAFESSDKQKVDIEGFRLIYKSFEKLLSEIGVREMEVGTVFDPERHEALVQVQSSDHTSGQIVSILQKGYILNGTVLRPAKVSVAQ